MPRTKKVMATSVKPVEPHVTSLCDRISEGKRRLDSKPGDTLFSQGAEADAIYFIESGRVKVTVVSGGGKEAVIAILGPNNFVGEGALVEQSWRVSTATVLDRSRIFRVERLPMLQALRDEPGLSGKFIASLLSRNIDLEADLCDQLFNHSEKRLARVLLKLARLQTHDVAPDSKIPHLSHETLAEMVGTTRSRVTHFMNKFRKLGLIDYNGELTVRTDMLTDLVLHD